MSEQNYQKHEVKLTAGEREKLTQIVRTGKAPARTIQRANVLLASDRNVNQERLSVVKIAELYKLHPQTVYEIRWQYCKEGLGKAITRKERETPPPPKVTGEIEAKIFSIACSQPPDGRTRWTMQLIADKTVELGYIDSLSDESVRRTLKKRD
jgi:hypothetical protein